MKVLIDTCILSEMHRTGGNSAIKQTLLSYDEKALFLSVITIGEISKGVFFLPSSVKKSNLVNWLNGLEIKFSERIIPLTLGLHFR